MSDIKEQDTSNLEQISSFHTHTYLCKHAQGTVQDYLIQAKKENCLALGFSDHCPYPEDGTDFWPDVRMNENEAKPYIETVRREAEKYDFPVYAGFECEFDYKYENWYRDFLLGEIGADYLILGPHWVHDGSRYVFIPEVANTNLLHKWTDVTIYAIQTGLFKMIAHPDLPMACGNTKWTKDVECCFRAILDAAIDKNIPLEINGCGLVLKQPITDIENITRPQYPYRKYWEIIADSSAKVICNSDAHNPENVLYPARCARQYAKELGIKPINTLF